MTLLDLRRQLHAAWVRYKCGERGSHAAHELVVRRWFEGLREVGQQDNGASEEAFALEHLNAAGRTLDECDPATCPYGS